MKWISRSSSDHPQTFLWGAGQRALLDYLTIQTSAGAATLEQTRLTKSHEQTQTETEQTGLTSNEYLLTKRATNIHGNLNNADSL